MNPIAYSAKIPLLLGLLILFLIGLVFLISRRPKDSFFRVREADRKRSWGNDGPGLAEARMKNKETLRLTGIRIDGLAHEILGIRQDANQKEIQNAYRRLMKIYHPDKVGPQGSREWNDSQKIAEAINRAKDEMFSRVKK